jgi:hypothetical protein
VYYVDFLAAIHEQLRPPTYFEIGVRDGKSLARSRSNSIGIDPAFAVKRELHCLVSLHRKTSDDYFAAPDAWSEFGGQPAAMSFIDGMHLFEYALRDFVNVERNSAWHSVVIVDDVMPRHVTEAARDRVTVNWTGDVYKLWLTLADKRPDLCLVPVHTRPTGLLLVLGADPGNDTLAGSLQETIEEYGVEDRPVPDHVLDRVGAVDPQALLDAGVFTFLQKSRESDEPAGPGRQRLRELLDDLQPRITVDWSTEPLPRPPLVPWPSKPPGVATSVERWLRRRLRGAGGRA